MQHPHCQKEGTQQGHHDDSLGIRSLKTCRQLSPFSTNLRPSTQENSCLYRDDDLYDFHQEEYEEGSGR